MITYLRRQKYWVCYTKELLEPFSTNMIVRVMFCRLNVFLASQRYIQNPVKHLRWSSLQIYLTVNYLRKTVHLRCLTGSWIRLWFSHQNKFVAVKDENNCAWLKISLSHSMPLVSFCTPWTYIYGEVFCCFQGV